MNKKPSLRKRIALRLFRKIRKNSAQMHTLNTLFWECTLRCNLSCLHCGSDCKAVANAPDMPAKDFMRVIDEITPHVNPNRTMITFTGGEALLRNDLEAC
ncbi:MAG: radical SAM/SPASM domain-containing protein, partial [Bacteroidales bacterium]|nr:radical SAM/SPASM domain-containing protein [Bacteroidales bacterium]